MSARRERRKCHSPADKTPEALLAATDGKVWSKTVDQVTAMQLQVPYQVSILDNQLSCDTLRLISATRPHAAAVVVDPSLKGAYLLAPGQ